MLTGARGFLRENSSFVRANARWVGGGFLLLLFSSFGQTLFIGLSGADLRSEFNLTGGGFGALYMVATLASAMTLPWLGRTLDVMPTWKVIRFTMIGLAAACLLLPFSPNILVLAIALYLLRLFGQGMLTEIAFTQVGRWFAANRGRATALVAPGLQAGSAILPIGFVLVQEAGGWKAPWIVSAMLVLLVGLPLGLWLLRIERRPRNASATTARPGRLARRDWSRAEVLADPILYLLLAGTLAPPFIGTVIFFHQSYLVVLRGHDPLVFASALPVMAATTVLFGFVCGHHVDRIGVLKILPYFLLPLAAACFCLAWIESAWAIHVFMLLLGVANGFTQTLFGALWPAVYGTANLGGIRAITVSAMVFATAAGPGLTGMLIDMGVSLPQQMIWMGCWCLVSCVVLGGTGRAIQARNG